jgi:hypothetical protein
LVPARVRSAGVGLWRAVPVQAAADRLILSARRDVPIATY